MHLGGNACKAQKAGLSHKACFLPKYPYSGTASELKKGKGSDEIPSTGMLTSEEINFQPQEVTATFRQDHCLVQPVQLGLQHLLKVFHF